MGSWLSQTPKPGDLIQISRGLYSHWAVYVGRGNVVHVTSPPGALRRKFFNTLRSVPTDKAMVRQQELTKVVGYSKWRINNILDEEYEPRPDDDIVEEALRQVGEVMEYSVTRENCEHFATKQRYGKAVSFQARNAEEAMISGGLTAVGLCGAVVMESGLSETEDNSDGDMQ